MDSLEIKEPKRAAESIHNRLYSSHIGNQLKLEELREKHMREEQESLTFRPEIFSNTERYRFSTIESNKGKSQTPLAKARKGPH